MSTFALVLTLVAIGVPIAIVVSIVRRLAQFSERLRDPTRLQQAFAESAAAALRRAGADPQAIARLGRRVTRAPPAPLPEIARPAEPGFGMERIELERDVPRAPRGLQRTPRARPHPTPALSPLGGFDAGDQFQLSSPPDLAEPHGPFSVDTSWIVLLAVAGAAAWYWLH